MTSIEQVQTLDLGDIVKLPDGREQTIRACERRLAVPVGTMHGWILAGEIGPKATLLSLPAAPHEPVTLFTPLEDIPPTARSARSVVEGVVSYWSPHLPNMSGAMGELAYRVCTLRTSAEPMVLVWRGPNEMVVFVKSAVTTPEALQCWFLGRDAAQTERDVDRLSSVVRQPGQVPAAAPAETQRTGIPLLPGRRR